MEHLAPVFMILLGVVGLTIYMLTIALRQSINKLTEMNQMLLTIIAANKGGIELSRALVATAKATAPTTTTIPPKKNPVKPKKGITETMGRGV